MENVDWMEWWIGAASFALTALTGLLAILAILAIFGFMLIKRHVEKIAKKAAHEAVMKHLSPEELKKMLQQAVQKASEEMFEDMHDVYRLEGISQQGESK